MINNGNLDITVRKRDNRVLKIDKRLPKIIIPSSKFDLFFGWWNSDIRFEKSIPHSFEEGYIIADNIQKGLDVNNPMFNALIKETAKNFKTTYRQVEKYFLDFVNSSLKITIYFKFLNENTLFANVFDVKDRILSNIQLTFGEESDFEPVVKWNDFGTFETFKEWEENFNYQCFSLLATSLWYIATSTNTTKYYYEEKTPVITSRHRNIVNISSTKTINTPIYDMSKIRSVKVEKLISRKKGWTYSHSFQVHGHYRHYRNGKVVFIKSYIKGKDKDFQNQTITLAPNE